MPAEVSNPKAVDYWPIRAKRAELAGLYYLSVADHEQAARKTNARSQAICAGWAAAQDVKPTEGK